MKRRTVLASVATSLATAGCLGSSDGPSASPALVEVANNTGEAVTLELQAVKDGETVHDEGYDIDGVTTEESEEAGEYAVVDGKQVVEEWMETPGEFEFRFSVPAYGLETEFTSDTNIGELAVDQVGNATADEVDAGQVIDQDTADATAAEQIDESCYFVRAVVGPESDTMTADIDAVPGALLAWAVVYDDATFDRETAGQCA